MPYAKTRRLPKSHARHTISRKAPLTDSQRKERAARAGTRWGEINDEVCEWKVSTLKLATDLAWRFNKNRGTFWTNFFKEVFIWLESKTRLTHTMPSCRWRQRSSGSVSTHWQYFPVSHRIRADPLGIHSDPLGIHLDLLGICSDLSGSNYYYY